MIDILKDGLIYDINLNKISYSNFDRLEQAISLVLESKRDENTGLSEISVLSFVTVEEVNALLSMLDTELRAFYPIVHARDETINEDVARIFKVSVLSDDIPKLYANTLKKVRLEMSTNKVQDLTNIKIASPNLTLSDADTSDVESRELVLVPVWLDESDEVSQLKYTHLTGFFGLDSIRDFIKYNDFRKNFLVFREAELHLTLTFGGLDYRPDSTERTYLVEDFNSFKLERYRTELIGAIAEGENLLNINECMFNTDKITPFVLYSLSDTNFVRSAYTAKGLLQIRKSAAISVLFRGMPVMCPDGRIIGYSAYHLLDEYAKGALRLLFGKGKFIASTQLPWYESEHTIEQLRTEYDLKFLPCSGYTYGLNDIRKLYLEVSDFRTVMEAVNKWNTYSENLNLHALVSSLRDGLITESEFIGGINIEEHEGTPYNTDRGVVTRDDNLIHVDDSAYCEGYECYVHEDDIEEVRVGRDERSFMCRAYLNSTYGYHGYRQHWYSNEGLEAYDLIVDDDGNVWTMEDYYEREDYTANSDYLSEYHSTTRVYEIDFDGVETPWKVGFEIEKEDESVLKSLYIHDFRDITENKWKKEADGSLDKVEGFELISPVMPLNTNAIKEYIYDSNTLVEHINAAHSNNCGGHINLSHADYNGVQLFHKIKGYNPLLYALYFGRVGKNYCKGKSNKNMIDTNEKYQAVRIHDNRIEYRIFSAVHDVDSLLWRSELLELMTSNLTDCPKVAYYNVSTLFTSHLRKMYPSDEKFTALMERYVHYIKEYEEITIETSNETNNQLIICA